MCVTPSRHIILRHVSLLELNKYYISKLNILCKFFCWETICIVYYLFGTHQSPARTSYKLNAPMFFIFLLACVGIAFSKDFTHEYHFDKSKASNYPSGTCNIRYFTCLESYDNSNVINEIEAKTPYDCCKTCLGDSSCLSWTHFYENKTTGSYLI